MMCNIEGTQIRKVHLVVEHNLVVGEGVGGGGGGGGGGGWDHNWTKGMEHNLVKGVRTSWSWKWTFCWRK
jgi:hypothetical protein